EDHRLAGAGLRGDESALALPERRDQIDDAGGQVLAGRIVDLHPEAFVRVERRQVVEVDLVPRFLRILEVDAVHLEEREVTLALFGPANLAIDGVAGTQREPADL